MTHIISSPSEVSPVSADRATRARRDRAVVGSLRPTASGVRAFALLALAL